MALHEEAISVLDSVRLIRMSQAVRARRTFCVAHYLLNNNSFHTVLIPYCGCEVIELSDIQCMALQIRTGIQWYKNDVLRSYLTKEALEGLGDFKIGGQIIHTVKYADDLVLLAKEEKVLQDMIDKLIEIGRCYGMELNVEKTK